MMQMSVYLMQCNISKAIFVEDGKHFNFYLLGGSWCQNLPLLCRSLKFVGISIPKIWLIFGHGVKRPGDLDL